MTQQNIISALNLTYRAYDIWVAVSNKVFLNVEDNLLDSFNKRSNPLYTFGAGVETLTQSVRGINESEEMES